MSTRAVRGSSLPPSISPTILIVGAAATLVGVLLGVLYSEWAGSTREQGLLSLSSTPTSYFQPLYPSSLASSSRPSASRDAFSSSLPPPSSRPAPLSDARGYAAVLYSGTARSFSVVFISHLLHLICSSPLTMHLFFTVMVVDNSSEHLSVASTLGRYDDCQNPDGDWLNVESAVKGWRLQRQSEIDYERELDVFVETYKAAGSGWQDNALKLYWAQHAVDEMRREYEEREGIRYSWVSRQRLDVLLATDIWQSLYTVTPLWDYLLPSGHGDTAEVHAQHVLNRLRLLELRPQHLPDREKAVAMAGGNDAHVRSYLVGDLVFTPRVSSSQVNIPGCSGYGGINDQFAIGGSDVMRVYFQRSVPPQMNRTRSLVSGIARIGWYQTETFLFFSMQAHGIRVEHTPDLCFQLLYTHHAEERPSTHNGHVKAPTDCSIAPHGRDCCAASCGTVNGRREQWYRTIHSLSSAAPASFAAHAKQLHDLAVGLAKLSGHGEAPQWQATLSAMKGAAALLQTTADGLITTPSASEYHYAFTHSPSSLDHTPPATHAYLQEMERVDDVVGQPPAGLHFALYSQWISLARRLALTVAVDGNWTAAEGLASRAEGAGDLGRFTWGTVGTRVGLESAFCNAASDWVVQMFPYTYAEKRLDILRLSPLQQRRSRFQQHHACTHHWTIKYTV